MSAIGAIGKTFCEASICFYGDSFEANRGVPFLEKEARTLMDHMARLARQINDNYHIHLTLSEVMRMRGACDE